MFLCFSWPDNEKMDSSTWWGHVLCPVFIHVLGSGSVGTASDLSRNLQSSGKLATQVSTGYVLDFLAKTLAHANLPAFE